MKILKTQNGDWLIDINFLALKKIRARVMRRNGEPLDLMNIVKFSADGGVDTSILDELADDSLLLLELVYTILQEQATERGISEERFFETWQSDDLEKACDLFLEELIDFFPEAKSRALRKILASIRTIKEETLPEFEKLLKNPELQKKIDSAIRGISPDIAPASAE